MTKKILSTLCGILSTFMLFGQLALQTDNYTKDIANPKAISVCDTSNLGFSIPLNDDIKKYDKFSIQLMYRQIGENVPFQELHGASYINLVDFPTSKAFKDSYQGKTKIQVCIKASASTRKNSIFLERDFCGDLANAKYYTSYEYKLVVRGYFESGTETYWDDYSESVKTRKLYEYSKDIYTTVPFSFVMTPGDKIQLEETAAQLALEEKRFDNYFEISKKYKIELEVPLVGTTQPRIEIFKAYELLRKELIENNDFETLDKVDAKLLSISGKFNVLNKTLKGETDTKVIMQEILQFPN